MKIITLLLMAASIGVAQAQIYKCPGKVEGQYTYQERPCKGAKANEHLINVVPADEKKIAEAQAKLARDIDPNKDQRGELKTESNSTNHTSNPAAKATADVSSSPVNTPVIKPQSPQVGLPVVKTTLPPALNPTTAPLSSQPSLTVMPTITNLPAANTTLPPVTPGLPK